MNNKSYFDLRKIGKKSLLASVVGSTMLFSGSVYGATIPAQTVTAGNSLTVANGTIVSDNQATGSVGLASNTTLNINSGGIVEVTGGGGNAAVNSVDSAAVGLMNITNAGTIRGTNAADIAIDLATVATNATNTVINNSGTITAGLRAITTQAAAGTLEIFNSGSITTTAAATTAILATNGVGNTSITNTGTITGLTNSIDSNAMGANIVTITNIGTTSDTALGVITGAIVGSGQADVLNLGGTGSTVTTETGGKIVGNVDLGAGATTLNVNRAFTTGGTFTSTGGSMALNVNTAGSTNTVFNVQHGMTLLNNITIAANSTVNINAANGQMSNDGVNRTLAVNGTLNVTSDANATAVGAANGANTLLNVGANGVLTLASGKTISATQANNSSLDGTLNIAGTLSIGNAAANVATGANTANINMQGGTWTKAGGNVVLGQGGNGSTATVYTTADSNINAADIVPTAGSTIKFKHGFVNGVAAKITNANAGGNMDFANVGTVELDSGFVKETTHDLFVLGTANQIVNGTTPTVSFANNKFIKSATLLVGTTTNANDTLKIKVTKKTFDEVADVPADTFAKFSSAFNQAAANSNDVLAIGSQLESLTGEKLVEALEQLVPEHNLGSHTGAMIASNKVTGLGFARLAELRTSSSYIAGDRMMDNMGAWLKGFGSTARQKRRKNVEGYNSDTGGISFGWDAEVMCNLTAGLGLGYAKTKVTERTATKSYVDVDSYQGLLYGGYKFKRSSLYLDGALSFGSNKFDRKRNISVGTIEQSYEADHRGNQVGLSLEAGHHSMVKTFNFTPKVGLAYVHSKQNSYTEKTNVRTGSALYVGSSSVDVLQGKLGLNVSKEYEHRAGGKWMPSLELSVLHDFIGDKQVTTNQFLAAGSPTFEVKGAKPDKTSMVVGLGLKYVGDRKEVSMNYDFENKNHYLSHAGYIAFRYKW